LACAPSTSGNVGVALPIRQFSSATLSSTASPWPDITGADKTGFAHLKFALAERLDERFEHVGRANNVLVQRVAGNVCS
jgi:hypothetical protein